MLLVPLPLQTSLPALGGVIQISLRELKRRKEEEKRLQKEREIEKNQDEVNAKFKRRLENLPPEEDCWFEDELM